MHDARSQQTSPPHKKTPSDNCSRAQLKRDGTKWWTGGEVKGTLANGVGSQYPSHYLGTWFTQHTTADAQTSAASSRLNWRPRKFKWTRPFRRKTKSGFCACAIPFQTQSTTRSRFPCMWHLSFWDDENLGCGLLRYNIVQSRTWWPTSQEDLIHVRNRQHISTKRNYQTAQQGPTCSLKSARQSRQFLLPVG